MVLEFVVTDGARTGVALRRHRGPHDLHGKGQAHRLAKMLPTIEEAGSAALLSFTFVEWLVAPILFPDEAVKNTKFYRYTVGVERMGIALD